LAGETLKKWETKNGKRPQFTQFTPNLPNLPLKWWREESHIIDVEDVKRAVEQNPETIVIGTGESGIARVTEEAKKFIQEKGIKLIIDKTEEAAKTFNIINAGSKEEEGKQNKVIDLFHLTC